jgi:hypothetical protein
MFLMFISNYSVKLLNVIIFIGREGGGGSKFFVKIKGASD